MFIVKINNAPPVTLRRGRPTEEFDYFLRGTTWTFRRERAQEFGTEKAAREALAKAAKFMPASSAKRAEIIPA